MTILAWINQQTNVCDRCSLDDRQPSEIEIPGYFLIDLEKTTAVDWVWDSTLSDWVAVEGIGNGGIGDIYENGKLVQPKPPMPIQPTTSGTQDV